MLPRPRRLTPITGRMWFFRIGVVLFLLWVTSVWVIFTFFPAGPNPRVLVNLPTSFVLLWLSLRNLGRAISVTGEALVIQNGVLSYAWIRFDQIDSFVWRHNLGNLGGGGERLWIALTDGQWCPTPVVRGGNGFGQPDINMSEDQASGLVVQLEQLRHESTAAEDDR